MSYKKDWQNFEDGPCDYAVTGTHRKTYWLRLRSSGKVVKITSATPSAYADMEMAHYKKTRAKGYEGYAFGYKTVGLD